MKAIKKSLSKEEKNHEELIKKKDEIDPNILDKKDPPNNIYQNKGEENNDKLTIKDLSKNKFINIVKDKERNLMKETKKNNINYYLAIIVFEFIIKVKIMILSDYIYIYCL